ncbi:hypothetical protein [Nocardiopsis coralliicola]
MKRFATVSGLLATTALALGAMAGTASADNNADVQNISIPVCVDALATSGIAPEGCSVIDIQSEEGIGLQ